MTIMYRYIKLAALAAAMMVQACDARLDETALVELGLEENEYVVEAEAGSIEFAVYSNGPYHIEGLDDENTWLTLSQTEGSGDATIKASLTKNENFRRMAKLVFCSEIDERKDTIVIKQAGMKEPVLKLLNNSIVIPGKGGTHEEDIVTNIPSADMEITKIYDDGQDPWLTDIVISDGESENRKLSLTAETNTDEQIPRSVSIDIRYRDGWEEDMVVSLNVVQCNANEEIGRTVSFQELEDVYAIGKTIDDYIIIEGYVVSNTESGNAGENQHITTSKIDYEGSKTTVYLESIDGTKGLCIHTQTERDNIFRQFDHVKILLKDVLADLKEQPDRVELSGVTSNMVVSRSEGTKDDIPSKEIYYSELTDDDIYTYVTLKDVELPVRKASLVPCNGGYAVEANAGRFSKYPLLVRDKEGSSFYMITNTVCAYRNNGRILPYGSGKLSGVVVHERFSRFEWRNGADPVEMDTDPELGYIGRYQLRHQSEEDIWGQMNESVEDSFSGILAEYRFWNPDMGAGICYPTYGSNGWFTHTYQTKYTGDPDKNYTQSVYKQHFISGSNYQYLGPVGTKEEYMFGKNVGNENGLGIVLDLDKEHYAPNMEKFVSHNPDGSVEWCGPNATDTNVKNINKTGKAEVSGNCYCAFRSNFWWDSDLDRPYAWLLCFSTKDLQTDHLSMQISTINISTTYTPRFWVAEYSTETDSQKAEDDDKWHKIADYTVPDLSSSNTLYCSSAAAKYIDFELPLTLLGYDNVYIRLRPSSEACSDGTDYANAKCSDNPGKAANNLEYIAIRYNK